MTCILKQKNIDINKMDIAEFASFLRMEIDSEKMEVLDFSYLRSHIDNWWEYAYQNNDFILLKSMLSHFILNKIKKEDLEILANVGLYKTKVVAVSVINIFTVDSPKLSLLVHEALSELFLLNDIQYEYEEHKTLYLKESAIEYKDWGSGYGEIMPHSDDLYERLNIDYLSLTICRDKTKTPTRCYFPKDLIKNFTDEELYMLLSLKARFRSGKNVRIILERERNVLEFSEKYGFRFFLDFRVDNNTGERMVACDPSYQYLLDKMRNELNRSSYISSNSETGTFLIVANHKVLHSRGKMEIEQKIALKYSKEPNLHDTPRLLYRSKGPRKEYLKL